MPLSQLSDVSTVLSVFLCFLIELLSPSGATLSVMGTDGRSAKAPSRVFVVEKSVVSFVRRRDSRLVGRTASGAGADGCEPPGGQDALDDE